VDISPASIIDYALLRPDVTKADIERACREAVEYGIHAVFVNPCWVAFCAEMLDGAGALVGSVCGFPLGATCRRVKALEAERVVADGAREVDMVINISALRSRDLNLVEEDIVSVRGVCPEDIVLKVILECCLLTDEEKGLACEIAERAGADFVKTSTGMNSGGATVRDVHLLRGACSRRIGIKAAGGINALDDVISMCKAGASRIGTSSAVGIIDEWNMRKEAG
jgi:deoxyribose-phosphate aldolase